MKKRKRMSWISAKLFLSLMILFAQNESVNAGSCLASIPTLQSVKECPKTQQKWNERSALKRCDMLAGISECSSFAYHCLLNQDGNGTVEVCAPTWYLSGFCAIYNTDEFRVIDNFNLDCNKNTKIKEEDKCPSRYISTETYKYQICYRKPEQKNPESDRNYQSNMENGNSISVLTVVFIVLFIVALIAIAILVVLLYRGGCAKLCQNGNTHNEIDGELECIPENQPPKGNQGNTGRNQLDEDYRGDDQTPLLKDNQEKNEPDHILKDQEKVTTGNDDQSHEKPTQPANSGQSLRQEKSSDNNIHRSVKLNVEDNSEKMKHDDEEREDSASSPVVDDSDSTNTENHGKSEPINKVESTNTERDEKSEPINMEESHFGQSTSQKDSSYELEVNISAGSQNSDSTAVNNVPIQDIQGQEVKSEADLQKHALDVVSEDNIGEQDSNDLKNEMTGNVFKEGNVADKIQRFQKQ